MLKSNIKSFNIPRWLIPATLGIFIGLSTFTFFYAKGNSYFLNDPKACMNCHVMRDQFDAWNRSSHKSVATCNSCHTPKDLIGKYAVKGINGWNHSVAFTSDIYHKPMQIKSFNRKIVVKNCISCHKEVLSQMLSNSKFEKPDCILCHGNVGHNERD